MYLAAVAASSPEGVDWTDETALACLEIVQKANGLTRYAERGPPPPSEGGPLERRGHVFDHRRGRWVKPRAGKKLQDPSYGAMWREKARQQRSSPVSGGPQATAPRPQAQPPPPPPPPRPKAPQVFL